MNAASASPFQPDTGFQETEPRLSRVGVFGILLAAAAALGFAAPAVAPLQAPADIEGLVAAGAWWVSAVLIGWLAVSLCLWLVALGFDRPDLAGWLRFVTLPGSRKLAEGLMAVTVVMGASACAPAANEVSAPVMEVLREAEPAPAILSSTTSTTLVDTADLASPSIVADTEGLGSLDSAGVLVDTAELGDTAEPGSGPQWDPSPKPDPYSPGGSALAPTAGPVVAQSETASTHTISEGENFWLIAEQQMGRSLGRSATDAEITPYWVALVKANQGSIQSGNPDLVYPGEVITLPPVS